MAVPIWFEEYMSILEDEPSRSEAAAAAMRFVRLELLAADVPLADITTWKRTVQANPMTARTATLAAMRRGTG